MGHRLWQKAVRKWGSGKYNLLTQQIFGAKVGIGGSEGDKRGTSMNKNTLYGVTGIVIGMVFMAFLVWQAMPGMMLIEHKSAHGYEETVAAISKAIEGEKDWKVLAVRDYQKSIREAGHGTLTSVGSMAVCNPRYASMILEDDNNKKVTAFMPLAIGVYEKEDGQAYISELNVGLLGMMFGGKIAEVMGYAGKDLKMIIASAEKK
jgi:uncharacterized protein (DUF302 family)